MRSTCIGSRKFVVGGRHVVIASVAPLLLSSVAIGADQLDTAGQLVAACGDLGEVVIVGESVGLPSGQREVVRARARASGEFGVEQFAESFGNGARSWDTWPQHFVAYEAGTLRVAESGGNEYQDLPFPDLLSDAPGPIQWIYCPWPVVPRMISWLESASDLNIQQIGDQTTAKSIQRQLSLTWSGDRLIRVVRGDESTGHYQCAEFSEFAAQGNPAWMPGLVVVTLDTGPLSNGNAISHQRRYKLTFRSAAPRASEQAIFDAVGAESSRYDAASGNVFGPDGQIRYNKNDIERALRSRGPWNYARHAVFVLIGIAALIAVLLGIRRMRS